jgi:flagellar hook-basal body complex protein FliE
MSIEGIGSVVARSELAANAAEQSGVAGSNLYETLVANLEQLNSQMVSGQGALQELALGDMDNLHQLIMGMERTRLSFDLLMSVRNRVLEAYQEIIRMQV